MKKNIKTKAGLLGAIGLTLGLCLGLMLGLAACASVEAPAAFVQKDIYTKKFTLASWQKITDTNAPYKVYIEGDGYAFNRYGLPTSNPTPRGAMVREVAFGDPSPNVIYMARPCQFVDSDPMCEVRYWTGARFSPLVVDSMCEAVGMMTAMRPVTLVGYSGGGMIAGLLSVLCPVIKVKEVITIAGNLDHVTWTRQGKMTPLNESMNLVDFRDAFELVPQRHYVGSRDEIVPYTITFAAVPDRRTVRVVKGATHHEGWESIYPEVWR